MAQQGEKSHGQLRRDDQIGIDAQPLSLLDKVGVVGFMGGVALAVDGEGKAPGDIVAAFAFQPADGAGPGSEAIVAQVHAKAHQMLGIHMQRHIVDDAVIGAAFILQGVLGLLQKALLLPADGKAEPHIHQIAQAALRVAFDGIKLLTHHRLDEGTGNGIDGAGRHGDPFFRKSFY